MLKKLKLRSLQADDSGFVPFLNIILLIAFIGFLIWLLSTIASLIVPLVIFMLLAIILVLIVKRVLFGGKGLGIISGLFGATKEAGRETVGLIKGAKSEYEHYKKKEGGW